MKPVTRRSLLAGFAVAAAGFGGCRLAQALQFGLGLRSQRRKPAPAEPQLVLFGTDTTRPGAKGIYAARFDASGRLSVPSLAAACVRPSFMARAETHGRHMLYAVNEAPAEQSQDQASGLSAFQLDPGAGILKLAGRTSSGGRGPCYVSVDAASQSAYVADYNGGVVASYLIQPDGTLSQPVARVDFHEARFGPRGPNTARQDAPHPHAATLSPDNRFLVVCDLGSDTIVTFPVDVATARLGPPQVNQRRAGSGPRHVVFHPNGRWLYAIDELDNRIDLLLWNTTRGDPAHGIAAQALVTDAGHSVSTPDAGFHGVNTAAEIAVSPSGTHVYVSNRGENSLVVFKVDETSGDLTLEQRIACGGKGPRQFTLDPTAGWLLCANQDSGTVTVFTRNQGDGRLSGPTQTIPVPAPEFILFA